MEEKKRYPEFDADGNGVAADRGSPESRPAAFDFPLSRRDFLKITGGGLVIFFTAGLLPAQAQRAGRDLPADFNAFLRIGADGRVSCFTGKVELGQGAITSLAQMLADELDVPLDRVDMVMGDTDLCPWDMGTFGSRSIRFFGPPLREAAAEARIVLLMMAAERLGVDMGRLTVKDGVVSDRSGSGEQVTYAELTRGRLIERHLPAKPTVKKVSEFKVMGKPHRRTDSLQKVTGQALYAGDIRLPGMLHAKLLRPPVHGAKLKRVDTSALRSDPELLVVEEPDLVAVLHKHPDVAAKALSLVKAEFDLPANSLDSRTIHGHLLAVAPKTGEVVSEGGDLAEGEKLAAKSFDAEYVDYYVAHAAMETHTATARVEGERVTVWPSTQTPFPAKESIARALGIPAKNVRVIMPFVGGGFGGKSFHLQAVEAARLAKKTGRPVQVMWSRKEEFFYDTFRPASIVKIRSGVDAAGKIVFWKYDVYYAGPRGAEQIYAVPHHRETAFVHYTGASGSHPFATGPWRAPGNNSNTFARESQIDIMAAALGEDPLAFRLKNLDDPRMVKTLKAAAAAFGWQVCQGPERPGLRRGLLLRRGDLRRRDGRGGGEPDDGRDPGQAAPLCPGDGDRHQPRGGEAPDGGGAHHGARLCADRGGRFQGRQNPERQFRHLQDPPLLLAAGDRDDPGREQRRSAPGRRRAGHHRRGRGDRKRPVRRRRYPALPGADDARPGERGPGQSQIGNVTGYFHCSPSPSSPPAKGGENWRSPLVRGG